MFVSHQPAAQTRTDPRPSGSEAGQPQGGVAPQVLHGLLPPQLLWAFPYWIVPMPAVQRQMAGPSPSAAGPAASHQQVPAASHQQVPAASRQPGPAPWHQSAPSHQQGPAPSYQPGPGGASPYQTGRESPPPTEVQGLPPVAPVPGVAMVAYPVLPRGARERRYWL